MYASFHAIEPAILNAISDESTLWYEPSTSSHADALHRRAGELAVVHRLLDALVDGRAEALRDDAADDLVDELVARPAVDRLDHDVAVAELAAAARLLLVAAVRARLASGSSRGRARAAGAARRRRRTAASRARARPRRASGSSRRGSPRRSAGRAAAAASGPPRRAGGSPSRPSPRRPSTSGVIAKLITGSGKPMSGSSTAISLSIEQVAGLDVLQLRDGADVALAEVRTPAWCSLPWSWSSVPMRSLACPRALTSVVSAVTVPLRTRKRLIRPANGSAIVLKTKAAVAAPSIVDRRALLRRRRHALDDEVEQRVRAEVLRRDAARDREHLAARDRRLQRGRDLVRVELLARRGSAPSAPRRSRRPRRGASRGTRRRARPSRPGSRPARPPCRRSGLV